MKKIKENKGITLIALIITIIVLIILAVVAISAVQGDGIIAHAKNARDDYQVAQEEENVILGNYISQLNNVYDGKESVEEIKKNGKTLNPNAGSLLTQELLEYVGSEILCPFSSGNIFFKNGDKTIAIYVNSGDTMNYMQKINVIYSENGETQEYAFKNWNPSNDYFNQDGSVKQNSYCAGYDNVPSNTWSIKGSNLCDCSYYPKSTIYESITELPVFEGKWELDIANSDSGLVKYLSNVLIDIK